MLADAGYCSANNLDAATDYAAEHGTEFYIATGRHRRGDPPPVAPRGRIPNDATEKQRMARKLATNKGRIYARRKAIVEPVFGQMQTLQNAKQLLLRGLDQARGEWLLLATCHNLRKLHGQVGVTGLAALAISRRPSFPGRLTHESDVQGAQSAPSALSSPSAQNENLSRFGQRRTRVNRY